MKLVVPEREERRADASDLGHDLLDGAETQSGVVDLPEVAVAAAVGAAARGHHGTPEQALAGEIEARQRCPASEGATVER